MEKRKINNLNRNIKRSKRKKNKNVKNNNNISNGKWSNNNNNMLNNKLLENNNVSIGKGSLKNYQKKGLFNNTGPNNSIKLKTNTNYDKKINYIIKWYYNNINTKENIPELRSMNKKGIYRLGPDFRINKKNTYTSPLNTFENNEGIVIKEEGLVIKINNYFGDKEMLKIYLYLLDKFLKWLKKHDSFLGKSVQSYWSFLENDNESYKIITNISLRERNEDPGLLVENTVLFYDLQSLFRNFFENILISKIGLHAAISHRIHEYEKKFMESKDTILDKFLENIEFDLDTRDYKNQIELKKILKITNRINGIIPILNENSEKGLLKPFENLIVANKNIRYIEYHEELSKLIALLTNNKSELENLFKEKKLVEKDINLLCNLLSKFLVVGNNDNFSKIIDYYEDVKKIFKNQIIDIIDAYINIYGIEKLLVELELKNIEFLNIFLG